MKTAEGVEWIRSRPPVIQALLRKFPPMCRVRGTRPLQAPPPGRTGQVVSYFEDGTVSVVSEGVPFRACCEPEWLEVVEYHPDWSPADVAEVLGGRSEA